LTKILPPRLRDWTKGVPQVGVFIQTGEASVIELCRDRATEDDLAFAMALVMGLKNFPPDLVRGEGRGG
jgi:hypothetical protein